MIILKDKIKELSQRDITNIMSALEIVGCCFIFSCDAQIRVARDMADKPRGTKRLWEEAEGCCVVLPP